MACNSLTLNGLALDCGSVGGLAVIYIADKADVASVGIVAGEITGITMASGKTFKTFNFRKNNANLVSTGNRSDENGTYYVETVIEAKFNKMETAKRTEMESITNGNTLVIAKDQNGLSWLVGHSVPDLNTYVYATASGNSGAAMADANQYSLTLTSMTPALPYQIATAFSLAAIVS